MKTITFFSRKATHYSLIGFLSVLITSCGSYQNSSYYDSDGIYGNTAKEKPSVASTQYKNYFSSLQENNDVLNDTIKIQNQGYKETNIVNVYNDPWNMSFGMGFGYGWGDPFFGFGWGYPGYGWGYPGYGWGWGAGFGWGYPGWGWGYPGYGWGYPVYGYNNNYSYNSSRRGSSYANGVNGGRYSQTGVNSTNRNRGTNYSNVRNRDVNSATRNSSSFMTRDYTQNQNNSSRTRSNTNTNGSRSQNYSNTRSYSPSTNSYNSGGGRSSGGGYSGGGGGRSSSGGRR